MIWETNDCSMYVYDGGESHVTGAATICFIHGAAMDHTVWTLFARYWAKNGFNVAAVDLPGHGLTNGRPFSTIDESASFLCEAFETYSPQGDIYWVGHSMGSLIALECARAVRRSKALVLMGTAYPMRVGEALLESARANEHMAIDIISLFGHSYGSQLGGNPVAGIHAQFLAERLMEQAEEDAMYLDLNACHTYDRGLESAAEVACSCYFILGELDRMTPAGAAKSLVRGLPSDTEVITLPGCGHMMMTEQPEQTHRALCHSIESAAGAG